MLFNQGFEVIYVIPQGNKYDAELSSEKDKDCIVLIGKKLDGTNFNQTVFDRTVEALKCYNARIMTYDELLLNAESLYQDYLNKHREVEKLDNVLNLLDVD